jgi:DnaJ homolog subfamily C member 9
MLGHTGSAEETEDLQTAYLETQGSIGEIMNFIPHSTHADETRFIFAISSLISKGELPRLPLWELSTKDEKARLVRMKASEKEATEAEQLAKELGVWDEFYGSGKTVERRGKVKSKTRTDKDDTEDGEAGDYSALQALILKKKEKNMDSFFDNLAAKYAEPERKSKAKGKKRARDADGEEPSPKKKRSTVKAPDIDDEEFAKLQGKLFGDKVKAPVKPESRSTRSGRSKRS